MNATSYSSERCSATSSQPLDSVISRIAVCVVVGTICFVGAALFALLVLIARLCAAADDRVRLWKQLGAFAGLVFAQSCVRIVKLYASFSFVSRIMTAYGSHNLSAASKNQIIQVALLWQGQLLMLRMLEFWLGPYLSVCTTPFRTNHKSTPLQSTNGGSALKLFYYSGCCA
jgi:hypothetical protein